MYNFNRRSETEDSWNEDKLSGDVQKKALRIKWLKLDKIVWGM